ncbi:MAG: transglycosylase domain-containing protein [Acidimicrobiales bacterium]
MGNPRQVHDPSLARDPNWTDAVRAHRGRSAAAALAILLVLVAVVPPLRTIATLAASKVILIVTTPFAPSVKGLNTAPEGSKVLAADGSPLGTFDEGERIPIKVADLPPQVKGAVISAEDAEFYNHSGVNPSAIVRATLNMATGSRQQGGSTITQQLAKLNYTSGERTIFRKLREVLFASRLESTYTKDQLLERYLNQVYFGDGNYGIETAARRTFGVPAAQLSPDQAAAIAVRIRSPRNLDPRKNPDAVLDRRNRVLAAMADGGFVPKDQVAALQAKPLAPIPLPPPTAKTERLVVDRARREALNVDVLGGNEEDRLAKLEGSGLTIETNLDPKGQKAAHEAAQATLPRPEYPSAAIVSILPGDGAIKVLVGDSKGGQFDVATVGRRQPGSSFKPFTYAAALENGIHPGTTYDSRSPQTFTFGGSSFQVQNAEEGTGGPMTLDDATVESVNVVYMQVALKVGPDKVKKVAVRLGEPSDLEAVPSLALGGEGKGVSPLDQAAAYATFASGGTYAEPYLVARIKDAKGKVVWQHDKKTRKAMDQKETGVINGVLQRVVNEGTGKAAAFGTPVAGKTGTTNESKDVWFVGYTPQLATAVWVGNVDAPKPLTDAKGRPLFGGGPPARIFSSTMKAALQGVKGTPLQVNKPEDLGLKLPGAANGASAPPPPVNGAGSSTTSTSSPLDSTTQPTVFTIPLNPLQTSTSQQPGRTTTSKPCPTTTTASGPTTTLPTGVTSTTAKRPPGC